MDKTFNDELVEYPVKVLQAIGTDKTIVSLLTDDPNIDMDSEEADSVFDKYLFDYGYVDGTVAESGAYICVEAETERSYTTAIKNMKIYVTILCHKGFMGIDPSKFKGMIGNRRENLSRYIDKLLSGSDAFGIGELTLMTSRVVPAPSGFAARELTYEVPNFKSGQRLSK